MEINLKPKKIVRVLGLIICFFVLANFIAMLVLHNLNPPKGSGLYYLMDYFDMAHENNFPTYFSTMQLLLCAIVLALIAIGRRKEGGKDFWHWMGLSAILLFLSMDEALTIHEIVSVKIRHHVPVTGILFYAWIVPYSIFALAVLIAYIPFLLKLPNSVKKRMILAGAIFVIGALGFEAIESWHYSRTGGKGPIYMILTGFEEAMEMGGILLFLYSLLHYVELKWNGISLTLSAKDQATAISTAHTNATADGKIKSGLTSKSQLAN